MSRSGELSAVEPALVDVDIDAESELDESPPAPADVDEELEAEVLDPADPIVTVDPTPLDNPVEPALPPQAAVPRRAIRIEAGRMREPA